MFTDNIIDLNDDVVLAIRNLKNSGYTDTQISVYLDVSIVEVIKIK